MHLATRNLRAFIAAHTPKDVTLDLILGPHSQPHTQDRIIVESLERWISDALLDIYYKDKKGVELSVQEKQLYKAFLALKMQRQEVSMQEILEELCVHFDVPVRVEIKRDERITQHENSAEITNPTFKNKGNANDTVKAKAVKPNRRKPRSEFMPKHGAGTLRVLNNREFSQVDNKKKYKGKHGKKK